MTSGLALGPMEHQLPPLWCPAPCEDADFTTKSLSDLSRMDCLFILGYDQLRTRPIIRTCSDEGGRSDVSKSPRIISDVD